MPDPNLNILWRLLDYGWLSDSTRSHTEKEPAQTRSSVPIQNQESSNTTGSPMLLRKPGAANATSHVEDRSFDLLEDFDPRDPHMAHEAVSLDFMTLPDSLDDPWPQTLGPTDFLSTDFEVPSPWSQQVRK